MRTTAPAQWFHPTPVPAVVAQFGAAHAVRLDGQMTADSEACTLDVPASLRGAAPARVRSFLAGRHCADRALHAIGEPAGTALRIGAHGAPLWPHGVSGSITHSAGLAIAVAARMQTPGGIGIDCERHLTGQVADEIAARVLPEGDRVSRRGDPDARLPWPLFMTAVFSAKESVYKCLHPLTGLFFEFDAVAVDWIDIAAGSICLQVAHDLGPMARPGTLLMARFCVDAEHVVTAVTHSPGVTGAHSFDLQRSQSA